MEKFGGVFTEESRKLWILEMDGGGEERRGEERFLPFPSSSSPTGRGWFVFLRIFSCRFCASKLSNPSTRPRVLHPTRHRHRHPPRRDLRGSLPWLGESPPMQREGPGQCQYFPLGVDGAVRVKSVSPFSLSLSHRRGKLSMARLQGQPSIGDRHRRRRHPLRARPMVGVTQR